MTVIFKTINFTQLEKLWHSAGRDLDWSCIFTLPPWLESWWQVFGGGFQLVLVAGYRYGQIIGIAPLKVSGDIASFAGSIDVCDYQDFPVLPGMENLFFSSLFDYLASKGINKLKLEHVRPDSNTVKFLLPEAVSRKYSKLYRASDVSLQTALPGTWEEYLDALDKKQRHEIRRKLRRLEEYSSYTFAFTGDQDDAGAWLTEFLNMFDSYRNAKGGFMTAEMKQFFSALVNNMQRYKLVRFGHLDLNSRQVAMIIVFDYNNTVYLYNSAYDSEYSHLSAGLMSKVLAIRTSIELKRERWDFLKGTEPYKKHLGGSEVNLYSLEIKLS